MRLKDRLEEEFEEGVLAVERSGTCAGFEWTVTWETFGGDHPEMQVNGDSLSGNEVSISVQTIQNGGLFLEPIPGEFLRTPHSSGQVSSLSCQTSMRLIRERGLIASFARLFLPFILSSFSEINTSYEANSLYISFLSAYSLSALEL